MIKTIDYTNGKITEDVVLLLGYFDGMHVGHQHLLQQAKKFAIQNHCKVAIMTFFGNKEKKVIYTFEERLHSFDSWQIDYCIVANYNAAFRKQSGIDFIKHLNTIAKLRAVVCGDDFTFGYGAKCNVQALKEICNIYGIQPIVVQLCTESERLQKDVVSKKISTSTIKTSLKIGNLQKVEALLGGQYFIMGTVVHGNQLGKTINFPTANMLLQPEKVILKTGVYAVHILYNGKQYSGIANLGEKPTVSGSTKLLEVHIFNFNKEIYGQQLIVYFDKYIRAIQKFENLQQLKNQIKKDIEQI